MTAEAIGQFRRRRRWRHVLAITAGTVALLLGTAILAAQLTRRDTAGLPPAGAGAALYVAGALAAAWGAAGGFTRRLARWVPACLIFGALAVVVFMAAAVFTSAAETLTYQPGPGGASLPPPGAGRALAAELLGPADIALLLGPDLPELTTPGASLARSRSIAIWRNQAGMVSLNVKYSRSRAAGLERSGHTASRHGQVLRVRAGRAGWLVALQLRGGVAGDAEAVLAVLADRALGRLAAASPAAASSAAPG